ncbi:MAG: hypothetical protein QOF03_748 [Alphaproteobacteria bacterium]|nr:hypothetical protein [Alphaproteobacteria bacterium]
MHATRVSPYLCAATILPLLAACGGGGGGYSGSPTSAIMSSSSAPASSGGSTGSTAAPGITATSSGAGQWDYGTPQFATVGGPTFSGPDYPPPNTSFAARATSLRQGSTVTSQQDAIVTVLSAGAHSSLLHVVIPSIGMDETFSSNTDLRGFQGDTPFWGLNYVALGEWAHWTAGRTTAITESLFGYETPVNAIPTTGTAQFSGWASGVVFKGTDQGVYLDGTASVSVDFVSGKITGALTNMVAARIGGGTPWNDVSVSGKIGAGTNSFSGTTAVTSAPNSSYSLSGSATGRLEGAFFGPAAENIGALWSLTDSTGSAVGGFLAHH